ncbi:MAG: phosphotransferase [Microthrixaceae bacterium]
MGTIAGLEVGLPGSAEALEASWMEAVLRTSGAIDDATMVASVAVDRFEGGGLLSALYRAALEYQGGDGPGSVFIKFPMDVPHQRAMADGFGVYPKEVGWYREIGPRSTIRTPKVHAAMIAEDKSDYCVVLEDLSHLRQADRIGGMSWADAVVAIDALADYHADWTGSEELEGLSELFFGLDSPVYRIGLPGVAGAGWPAAKRHAPEVLTGEAVELGDEWVDLLPTMIDRLITEPTLCHCDWRADNMFFDDDGRVVIIDPQIAGVQNLAYDIGYFISQSVEPEVYRGRIEELVDRYVSTSRSRGVDLDPEAVLFDTRVAVAMCLMYGFASFPEFEHLDPASQDAQKHILRRASNAVTEFHALAAVRDL